jgi:amidophosphoribosyltransferase
MKRIVSDLNPQLDGFEASCFDGEYITKDISASEFAAIAQQRQTQDDDDAYPRHGLNLQGRTRER